LKKQNALLADIVMPDQVVDGNKTVTLGGTKLELIYVGRNHSDNSLVMRLRRGKAGVRRRFAPIETIQFRNIPDSASPLEYIDSAEEARRARLGSDDPRPPLRGAGATAPKKMSADDIAYMEDLSAEVKKAADAGKCIDTRAERRSSCRN